MTIQWIGQSLKMGSRHTVDNSSKLNRNIPLRNSAVFRSNFFVKSSGLSL